ncbi:hypothetical protein ABTC85_20545, partial [Acinetobacter baumannii]
AIGIEDMRKAARHGHTVEVDPYFVTIQMRCVNEDTDATAVPFLNPFRVSQEIFLGQPVVTEPDWHRAEARGVLRRLFERVYPALGQVDLDF